MSILDADFGGRRARRKAVRWLIVIAAVLGCFWLLPGLLNLYTEWLWFKHDVRYPAVFLTILQTKLGLGVVFGLAFVALVLINAGIARRLARRSGWYQEETALRQQIAEVMEFFASRYLYLALVVFALVVGYGVAAAAAAQWDKFLQFRNATPFGIADPIFNRDVGFYVFRLPFWQYLWQWTYIALIAVFIITAAVHYLDKAIRMLRGVPSLASHVKAHLSLLLVLILVVKAFGYRLEAYHLLYSTRGAVFGAGYTDVHAQLLAYQILFFVALAVAGLTLFSAFSRGIWLPLAGLGFLAAVSLLVNTIYPSVVQRFQVQPSEFDREKPYIERNLKFTRQAFGLADMQSRPMRTVALLGPDEVKHNIPTLENVRLWDYRPLLTTYQQQQALAQYYRFNSVDIDRYTIQGRYRQVMLAARELVVPPEARSWVNDHIYYTHGYGIVMSPVADAVQSGLPNYVILNLPPTSPVGLEVKRSGIYYGELTDDYIVTGTTAEENDYTLPQANKIAKTHYTGAGGVPLASPLARLAAAVRFSSTDLLISTLITKDSRVLWEREIRPRVQHLAPFLSYDLDPYIVLGDDGHLYWILDAYTTSSMFPYSQPYGTEEGPGINYVRNSVKVVVDAYDGTVSFHVADPEDPIIRTYARIFPGVFKDLASMPAGLQKHIRYAEGLFNAQAAMLTAYHVTETDPQVFYNGSERWEIAREAAKTVGLADQTSGGDNEGMQAYYTILSLPDRPGSEFLLMLPFTPKGKPNMVAWVAGQCDAKEYGRKLLYEFPKNEQVWGPIQIEAAINQNPDFSQIKTLLNQQGSNFFPGNLLVLPMDNAILYVEPYYLSATTQAIPELKYVIVARGDGRIAFGPTFSEALTKLLGEAPPSTVAEEPTWLQGAPAALPPAPGAKPAPAAPMPQDVKGLAQRADREYKEALDKQQKGDWAGYGESLKKLQRTLDELMKKTGG